MDNPPSATKYVDETNPAKPVTIYDLGFPLGFRGSSDIPGTKDGMSYLNNHLLLTIKYHKDVSFDGSRIVGFEVEVRHLSRSRPRPRPRNLCILPHALSLCPRSPPLSSTLTVVRGVAPRRLSPPAVALRAPCPSPWME